MAPLSNLTEFVSDFYAIARHIQFNTWPQIHILTTLSKGQTSTCKSKEQRKMTETDSFLKQTLDYQWYTRQSIIRISSQSIILISSLRNELYVNG